MADSSEIKVEIHNADVDGINTYVDGMIAAQPEWIRAVFEAGYAYFIVDAKGHLGFKIKKGKVPELLAATVLNSVRKYLDDNPHSMFEKWDGVIQ